MEDGEVNEVSVSVSVVLLYSIECRLPAMMVLLLSMKIHQMAVVIR